jgi:hypothetical protein
MQLNDWPLVEVELLLIGLTHIFFFTKSSSDPLGRDQISFRLQAQITWTDISVLVVLMLEVTESG